LCDVETFPGHSAALSVLTAAYMVQPAPSWPERSGVQVAIIPARYQSSRFPGKPLALIAGKPMIQRTWDQAKSATTLTDVYVATDDDRIRETCEEFGAKVLMTSPNCPNGTARCAEAALALGSQFDLVLNIQGDEPLLEPAVIDAVVRTLQEAPQDVRALLDNVMQHC
jgi:3-deoxy-manno-octulosonate cytidylyltransferase (CMP-KDO synthetase)